MAFPTTGILDAFTRANEGPPPSANWTADQMNVAVTGHSVVSNACTNGAHTYWDASTFGADQEAYFTITTMTAASPVGIHLRIQNPNTAGADAYECTWSTTGAVEVLRIIDAYTTETSLGTASVAAAASGHKFGAEATGTGATVTIKLYIDTGAGWTLALTATDSGATRIVASGYIGIITGEAATVLDDFGGGAIVVAGWGGLLSDQRNRLVA